MKSTMTMLFFICLLLSNNISYASVQTGEYVVNGKEFRGKLEVKEIQNGKLLFLLYTEAGDLPYVGQIEGLAVLNNNVAVFLGDDGCTLTMKFDNNAITVIGGNDTCGSYMGRNGNFDARYVWSPSGVHSTAPKQENQRDSKLSASFGKSIITARPGIDDFGSKFTVDAFADRLGKLVLDNGKNPVIEGWKANDNVYTLKVMGLLKDKRMPTYFHITHILSPPSNGRFSRMEIQIQNTMFEGLDVILFIRQLGIG